MAWGEGEKPSNEGGERKTEERGKKGAHAPRASEAGERGRERESPRAEARARSPTQFRSLSSKYLYSNVKPSLRL